MGSSKEGKREKKGRKEQRDKIKITSSVGSSKPSPQMASPPSQTSPLLWQCGTLSSCLAHHHLPNRAPTCHYHPHTHTHAPIMNEYSIRDLQAFTSPSVRVG